MDSKLIGLAGIPILLSLAWALSLNRREFPWRTVLSGLALQWVLAAIILKTRFGRWLFDLAQTAFLKLIDFSMAGAGVVFGPLAEKELLARTWGEENTFIFVVLVTATIIVISALSAVLYHYRLLQRVVRAMAWVMQRVMKTSGSESLAAAANIFMGQTEAPLVVKPYLDGMTRSELMALMVGGMSTIAGGVLAAYVAFGEQAGRMDVAGHLLTASVMSAPAGLLIAKILIPEIEESPTRSGADAVVPLESTNGLDALCQGAADGLKLAMNVMAMLIAFVVIVHLINYLIALPQWGVQRILGREAGVVTLEMVFGWVNAPFAWLMGVPWGDCFEIGQVLGQRLVTNEFLGYLTLRDMEQQALLEPRSYILATYALCGFANFTSIAVQIGGIGSLAPRRRADLARFGLRAMVGGVLACYLTAALVGLLL